MSRRILHRVDPTDERGATLLIVALSMVAIFGMVVLTVDLGGLLVKRRGMVNAADAAALAAAETFATNQAQTNNQGPAQSQADSYATQNQGNAQRDSWNVIPGITGVNCDPASCGTVSLQYHGGQSLFFAPILGFGQQVGVRAAATAIWGPAQSDHPSPIMIRYDWMTSECKGPVPNDQPPTECDFWLNDHDDNGNSLWSWINLSPYPSPSAGWNVPRTYNCPNVGASQRSNWIRGINVPQLPVNPVPAPTFVCTVSGHASSNFLDLQSQIGHYRVFPVNDATGQFAPPGQVDKSGNYCPPNSSCTPDKYDIVGFTVLRIDQVLHGTDPAAIGDPGSSGSCGPNHDFKKNPPNNTWDLNTQSCNITNLHYPGDPSKSYPELSKGNTIYQFGIDYTYDPTSAVITWTRDENVKNVKVQWDYVVPPTPGKCGLHNPDPNAVCFVVSWQGYQTGGINPGPGPDFGERAIRLSA